jgi:hypothetical protein
MTDILTIKRVANGWVIQPGVSQSNEFTHVAKSADDLAEHVRVWAQAQVPPSKSK